MGKEYSGAEIAQVCDVTRQYVSSQLKKAMAKAFYRYKELYPYKSDFEAAANLMNELGIEITGKNFKCFPKKIKDSIEESAKIYIIENNIMMHM